MNRNRPRDIRDNRSPRDRGGRNYGMGDGLLGEGPPGGSGHGGGPPPMMAGANPLGLRDNPLGLRDTQLALAQSLLQQQQLVNAGFGAPGGDYGSLGALAGGMHFLQQQQQQQHQHQMRAPMGGPGPLVGARVHMGGMQGGGLNVNINDRKRSGGQIMRRDNDMKRGRRDSYGRGERERSQGSGNLRSNSGQDRERNRSSQRDSDRKKRHGEDYDPAEPTEDDDEGGSGNKKDSNLYCHVCAVSVYDEESFQRHLNGLKHKARMESLTTVHQMRSTQLNSRLKAEEHLRNIERKGGRDPDYFCKICNNDLAIPWEKHRYSNIHKQRLLQVRKGCGWCKVHNFTNFSEVLEHRETDEHKKNSDLYGKKEDEKDGHNRSHDDNEKDGKPSDGSKKDGGDMKDEAEEVEEEEDLTIPEYNAEVPVGMDYVIPVTGYFCKLCHKFYNKKSARATHCQSSVHYEKFKEATEVKIAAREKRREEERLRKEKEAEEEEEAMEAIEGDDKEGEEEENGEEDLDLVEEGEGEGGGDEEFEEGGDEQEENDLSVNESVMTAGGDNNESTANATLDSSSFVYVSGREMAMAASPATQHPHQEGGDSGKADLQDDDVELIDDGDDDDDAKTLDGMAPPEDSVDEVKVELSPPTTITTTTTTIPEDDELDLSVPEEAPPSSALPPPPPTVVTAIATSTPLVGAGVEEEVEEEAAAPTPPAAPTPSPTTTRGKGTARRGKGRGRAKK